MHTDPVFAVLLFFAVAGIASAGEPVRVVPAGLLPEARQPQVDVGEDGRVYVAYGSGNSIYCSASADNGKSFGPPVMVGKAGVLAMGMRRGPRIAVHKAKITVTAIAGDLGRGRDGDLLAWRSSDGGSTWSGPVKVNDVAGSAREGLHGMAAGPRGELACVWLDLRHRKTEIYGAFSTDGGATWSANRLIYQSPGGSVCECCHPSVGFDTSGNLYVMWRNQVDGARDMYLAKSPNGGRSFAPAVKLGVGTWQLGACPMDGGAIAATTPESVDTVWMRSKEIFRATPGSAEHLLGSGVQPWVAAGPKGTYFVWLGRRPGDLYLLAPGSDVPVRLAAGAVDPMIGRSKSGDRLIVVWESVQEGAPAIFSIRVL